MEEGLRIECIQPYSRGLIFAGDQGMIFAFEATSNENQVYRPQQEAISSADRESPKMIDIKEGPIAQIVMNSTEDILYYIDR